MAKDKVTYKLNSYLKRSKEYWDSALLLASNYFPKHFDSALLLLNYSIELCLKAILLNQDIKMEEKYRTHNLKELWDCCKNKVDELNEMKIDEYIIMLNRVNFPNAGIRYPSITKGSEFSISVDVFKKLKILLDFTLNNVDSDKEINDLICNNLYEGHIREICNDWESRWVIFVDVNNYSFSKEEINFIIVEAQKTCINLDDLEVPDKYKDYHNYFYKYFDYISKCKNENLNSKLLYFNEANKNIAKSLDYSSNLKKCTNLLYKEFSKIK